MKFGIISSATVRMPPSSWLLHFNDHFQTIRAPSTFILGALIFSILLTADLDIKGGDIQTLDEAGQTVMNEIVSILLIEAGIFKRFKSLDWS